MNQYFELFVLEGNSVATGVYSEAGYTVEGKTYTLAKLFEEFPQADCIEFGESDTLIDDGWWTPTVADCCICGSLTDVDPETEICKECDEVIEKGAKQGQSAEEIAVQMELFTRDPIYATESECCIECHTPLNDQDFPCEPYCEECGLAGLASGQLASCTICDTLYEYDIEGSTLCPKCDSMYTVTPEPDKETI